MSTGVADIYVEAWTEPRLSIRRILELRLGERERLFMVGAHLIASAITIAVVLRVSPDSPVAQVVSALPVVPRYAGYLVATFGIYWVFSFLMKSVGGAFGGTADTESCKTAVAWWMLVTSVISFAEALLMLVVPGALVALLNLIAMIAGVFIFAAYTAEIHGFKSVGQVAGATVATGLGLLIVLNVLLISLMPS